MKWLLILMLVATGALAETEHSVKRYENALLIKTEKGVQMICLLTGVGYGFTNHPDKWAGMTCSPVEEVKWRFCKGINDKPLLICVPPNSKVNDK
jgi:hypothetical protein